ncbi:hypothetical protein O181_012175 [Austropuccinia psidii MF-1]|uniref:SGS domain-containing protein n=1 Tax=Austropuccinia psidii MF-1 TaxID=1389203 RepID=A0A9Q3BWL0_9BASI|nr:hypothetical protein [Austropuccinia psidii MF-1]
MADKQVESRSQPKVRHEWYQTDSEVVLSLFVKNTTSENVRCDIGTRSISILYKLPTHGTEGCFDLDPLSHEIDPTQSSWRSLSSKIEIKLKKKVGGLKWQIIEGSDCETSAVALSQAIAPGTDVTSSRETAYPSSARKKTNWEQLAQAAEKEEEESVQNLKDPNAGGDRALNELFQKLYAGASEDQKRAMMKSYTESNGTALSTDWEDVKKNKVETKPPESMVVRDWQT